MAKRGAKLGTSVLDLDVDDSKFNAGLAKNEKKARAWTANLGRDVRRGIGMGLGISGGLIVAQGVAAAIGGVKDVVAGSISAAIEWESAFAGVRKTVDASEAEFGELERAIRDMALEIPFGTTELAGLAEAAGALGIAKKDIAEFTRVTALIGTTTDVSSDQAATSLGQLSNVLRLTSADYERFGSTLVDLGNKGASTESQILEIAARAGAASKLVGMATDETLAWASAVANLGVEVEAGGSSLQKFFLETAKAVSEGSDKLDTYARLAGITAEEFRRAWEEDATGALRAFLAGLGELTQGDQLKALGDLDFNEVRLTRTLLGLANNAEMVGASLDIASAAWEENTALSTEAGRRFSTTASKLQVLNNRVNELAITFGEELTPALATAATVGVEQLEQFAGEVGSFAQDLGEYAQYVAGHFGDMGDEINALADEMGEDFMHVNDAVVGYMGETGASLGAALEAVRLYGTGSTRVSEEVLAHWEDYQSGFRHLLTGPGGVVPTVDDATGKMEDDFAETRDNAIQAMSDMVSGMTNLFETDESLQEAWQGLIDRMNDPYTEAERKADIFSQNTIDNIRGAIVSGDPGLTADAYTLVNNMLAQFALMEPGALGSGEAVPPAIREGMDAEMQALIDYIEREVTGEALSAMTLDEAKDLGLDGIWLYAQGMRLNAKEAADAAHVVSKAALTALEQQNWSAGGYRAAAAWATGLTSATGTATHAAAQVGAAVARQLMGESPPPEGPLKDIDKGAFNVGVAWAEGLALGAATLPSLFSDVVPHYSGAFDQRDPYREGGDRGTTFEGGINITAPTVPMTPRDIGRELQRTGVFGIQ